MVCDMKKIFFICVCLITTAGCASKPVLLEDSDAGLPTLNNLSRGELNLACEDARYLEKLFLSHEGVIFEFTAVKIAYPQEIESFDPGRKGLFDLIDTEYKDFQGRILAPYKNNAEAYGKVEATVISVDVGNVFKAAFLNYLGLMDTAKLGEYIRVSFCGNSKTEEFMSPADVGNSQIHSAILAKLKKLKK